jgi:DNA repair exonuclease SbcCD ATPase subunit
LKADIVRASRDLEEIKDRRDKTKREISTKTKELTGAEKKFEQTVNDDEKADIRRQIDEIKADLENAQSEFADFPAELEDAQTELKDARSSRISFWKATFKEDWILSDEEGRLINFADTIDSLYVRYGRYFKIPTNKEVIDILEALDKASPDWDKREPRAFYAELKATVPNCNRKSVKAVTSARGQGCLVLLMGVVSLVVYFVMSHWKS